MKDYKPIPKCPYCGWEMQHLFDYPMNYCDVRFYCKHCNAMAPSARGCQTNVKSVEEALEEAYEKAMRRYEEPNRVLTLEEITADVNADSWKFEWVERKGEKDIIHQTCPFSVNTERTIFASPGDKRIYRGDNSNYGVTWRCWLREPTPEEMANTPWEDEDER